MIVQNKTYKLEFRGRVHRIKRNDLIRLNNRLASSYKGSSEAQKLKIWAIILQLNWVYISNMSFQFSSEMDKEDFLSHVVCFIPQALRLYEESLGNFHTYLAVWKHAGFSKWQDERTTVHVPANMRAELSKVKRKLRIGKDLDERETNILSQANIRICSMSARVQDDDLQLQDTLVSEDPRESIGQVPYEKIWKQIKGCLPADEYQIFLLYHHDNYKLTLGQIGDRFGVSRERIRQRMLVIRKKVAAKLKVAGIMHGGEV